jgi:hypothetical protein
MKKLTCMDTGGPCDAEFVAYTFEDMKRQREDHFRDNIERGDQAHASVAARLDEGSLEQQQTLQAEFKRKFNEAPSV